MPTVCSVLRAAYCVLRYSLQCAKEKKFEQQNVSIQDKHFCRFLRPILRMEYTTESEELAYELITLLIVERPAMLIHNQSEGQLLMMKVVPLCPSNGTRGRWMVELMRPSV
jgi:hypothetical protein